MTERVTVPTDDGDMPAYLWLPESGTGPGLVLLQEIFGVSRYIARRGTDLADAGYVVLPFLGLQNPAKVDRQAIGSRSWRKATVRCQASAEASA